MVRALKKIRRHSSYMPQKYKIDKNLDNYVCHSFQARYLTGIAGMMTKTNKIGVVGSHSAQRLFETSMHSHSVLNQSILTLK